MATLTMMALFCSVIFSAHRRATLLRACQTSAFRSLLVAGFRKDDLLPVDCLLASGARCPRRGNLFDRPAGRLGKLGRGGSFLLRAGRSRRRSCRGRGIDGIRRPGLVARRGLVLCALLPCSDTRRRWGGNGIAWPAGSRCPCFESSFLRSLWRRSRRRELEGRILPAWVLAGLARPSFLGSGRCWSGRSRRNQLFRRLPSCRENF